MTSLRYAFFTLSLLWSLQSLADCQLSSVAVEPVNPFAGDRIDLVVNGSCSSSFVAAYRVRILPDAVELSIDVSYGLLPYIAELKQRLRVGPLPAGEYELRVRFDGDVALRQPLVVAERPFSVVPTSGWGGTDVLLEDVPWYEGMVVRFGDVEVPARPAGIDAVVAGALATVPAGQGAGPVDVAVKTRSGESLVVPAGFRYIAREQEREFEKVLWPVTYRGSGAHDSEWESRLTVRNDAPVRVDTYPQIYPSDLTIGTPPPMAIPPGGRTNLIPHTLNGTFLYAARGLEKYLSYASHAIDKSREATNRGTEIPVIRAEDTAPIIRIVNVPAGPAFRVMLRVFDFDNVERTVSITARGSGNSRAFIGSVDLQGRIVCVLPCLQPAPASGSVDLTALLPSGGTVDLILDAGPDSAARIWGFVTVTSNETQHVTTYTPQSRGSL